MSKIVLFSQAEQVERIDLDSIGTFSRAADDAIAGDAIGYPRHWAGFTVSAPAATTIRVTQGRFWAGDKVYALDAPVDIPVLTDLPLTLGHTKYIAILATGVADVVNDERFIETDVDTGERVPQMRPKTDRRRVAFVLDRGLSSPNPLKPVIAGTDCCVAYVLLSTTGIVAVEAANDYRVQTLYEVDGRVRVLEGQMIVAFKRTQTLETDLASVIARLSLIPRWELIRQMQRDLSQVRRLLSLPDDARAYFYDAGLVADKWEVTSPDWLGRVREGLRYGFAAERDSQLALLDPANPALRITGQIVTPKWTEVNRETVEGPGAFKDISQQQHTVVTAVERYASRSVVEYGPTVAVCDNMLEAPSLGEARIGEVFQVAGETFQNLGLITQPSPTIDLSIIQTWNPTATIQEVVAWNATPQAQGHQAFAAREVITRTYSEPYWDYVTTNVGVNGSVYAQTFPVTQPFVLTSIDLHFHRVGGSGDVQLLLCETSATGEPLYDKVICRTSKPAAELQTGWVKFPFEMRYIPAGRRYAWVTVTVGNHALSTVTGNRYANGTLFWSTDNGAWFQGSSEEDFWFRLNAARFDVIRAVAEFQPLTLDNGLTQLMLFYDGWTPPGCNIVWEVQRSGDDDWHVIQPANTPNPLLGLPALVRLRATFNGTPDLSPAIFLNSKARGVTQRHRTDARWISKVMNFGFSTTAIEVETVVDNFEEAHNTLENRVIVGSTIYTPSATTIEEDIVRAGRFTVRSLFTVPSTSSCRLRINSGTNSALRIPFVQNTSLFAI